MSKTITIQYRMTKKCNAECSYCINPFLSNERMSYADFIKSIDYLVNHYFKELRVKAGDFIDLEFVGGEVSLLPTDVMQKCSVYARRVMEGKGLNYSDGCQSNFIGSKEKLIALWDMFDGNISTSVDHFSQHRKFKGSAEEYRSRFEANKKDVTNGTPVRSVYVIDKGALSHLDKEFELALNEGYSVGFYPAYEANNPVEMVDQKDMANALVAMMDKWVLKSKIVVEPLAHILRSTCESKLGGRSQCHHACPFTVGCAKSSVCIEPNGDMYVCMDMAETKNFKIGNALNGEHDSSILRKLSKRGLLLESDCLSCPYMKLCHGGCLNHALISGTELSKSEYCAVWKALFENQIFYVINTVLKTF